MSATATADPHSLDAAGYEAFLDQLQAGQPQPREIEADLGSEPAPVAASAPPAQAASEAPATGAPAEQPATEGQTAEGEPPAEGQAQLANNWRLNAGNDPLTQLTFSIYREHADRGEHIMPSVAEALARERLNPQKPTSTQEPAEASPGEQTETETPAALAALQAQDAELATQEAAARNDLDEEKVAEIREQRAVLSRSIVKEELRAEMAQERANQEAAAYAETQAQSRAAVKASYGDSVKPGTAMSRVMLGIANEWEANGDPRFLDPRLPELAAAEAAKTLGITPAAGSAATAPPAAPTPSASQASPRSAPPVAPPIASGATRSTDPGPTLPEMNSMDDYYAQLAKMGHSPL